MYLMPYQGLTKDFLKQILSGQKMVLLQKDVKAIKVPLYEELNVDKLWKHYHLDERLHKYLPDHVAKGRQVNRKWFFDLFNSLAPEVLQEIIDHAESVRSNIYDEAGQQETIHISEEWR